MVAAAVFGSLLLPNVTAPAAAATTPSWLVRLNSWRATSGLSDLAENATWDQGDYNHSQYMVVNDLVTHYEDPTKPYYTVEGDTAAKNGNIEVSSSTATTDDSAIDWWMAAPFHAMGMMDPRLTSTGFGAFRAVKTGWQAGWTLDVLRGNSWTGGSFPVYFPGNGSIVPLTTFHGNETPDPLQACPGYVAPTGLPVFIEVGGFVNTQVSAHSFTGDGVPLNHCVIDSTNPTFSYNLQSRGGVILIPQAPLVPGVKYVVNLTVNGVAYSWWFGVTNTGSFTPGAPSGISVAAGDSSATVSWNPPSSTGGTPIVSYTVTSYIGGVAQTTQIVPATATSATFTGLTNGTTYTFSVAATNAAGTGPAATSYSVTPTSSTVPPARLTAVSTRQLNLPNSDGSTWQDMDAANLSLSVTPSVATVAVISGNADLWTANAGYNQDLGIWMNSNQNAPGIIAWKESGGLAGTYSPNAAAVQTVLPLSAGVTYSLKLQWKTNKPAIGATIFAGAGPLSSGQFSPTRLSVVLIPAANLATAVSNQQYPLAGSDGTTWQMMDAANLITTLVPTGTGTALVSANADLWTASSGYNQDIGVFVSVNSGADQLVGWKESGGSAGTYSPNAAFLQVAWPVSAGSTYAFKIKWKTNKNAAGATIFAGAGHAGAFSPTRLTAIFEPAGSLATASMNIQYHLAGSDGRTWQAMDPSGLAMSFTPSATANYAVSANADLWTISSGYNQDVAIFISGGSFATPTLLAWKESGGSAGTFSPNAAYAETVVNLQSGVTYSMWIAWKTNGPDASTIFAAAGPLAGGTYSPTRLTVIPQQ